MDWAQKGSATGYEIQYATNSKFTNAKKVTITNNKTDKTTISKLSGNKKYYVRVRSYTAVNGTKYYGAWSVSKSVTTKNKEKVIVHSKIEVWLKRQTSIILFAHKNTPYHKTRGEILLSIQIS